MKATEQTGTVWIRLVLCTAILAVGVGGFIVLKKMKKPPAQTRAVERPISVEAVRVENVSVPVRLTGFGQVTSRREVPLSAEVAGKVTSVHPRMDVGEIILKGEVLLAIDERDYRLDYETAEARLKTLNRDYDLAAREYERVQALYEKNKVGSLSSVEKAEAAKNAIADRISQVEQNKRQATLRLERSVLMAPFTSRISEVMVEENEYVTPGKKLVTIVDDSDLEIFMSLDSRDVIKWLRFDHDAASDNLNWFKRLESVDCQAAWTEDNQVSGNCSVDRVVRFDSGTRTIFVAVRLEQGNGGRVPLVDGMFCKVSMTGLTLDNVVILPRHAVSFENSVYVAVDDRLQTRQVKVARLEKEQAIISEGLRPGEIVVTTRLEEPLENSLLSVSFEDNQDR